MKAVINLFHLLVTKIDGITMYNIVLYALLFLLACTLSMGVIGFIPYTFLEQIVSLTVVVAVSVLSSWCISRLFSIPISYVSTLITALILFFLIIPTQSITGLHIIALASLLAVLSRYVLAFRSQHIANPAAIGVAVLSVTAYYEATWWIAMPELFIPLVMTGIVVVYKIRKWTPVLAFILVGFVVFLFEEWRFASSLEQWSFYWLSYPALFLAFFMLTEPFTMPPTKALQFWYGAMIGFLANTMIFTPFLKMSPELALVLGNIAFFGFSLRKKLFLKLIDKKLLAKNTYEWIFTKPAGVMYKAGQYMEWLLPHSQSDSRGERRYFTIASAPEESVIRVAAKVPSKCSSFKSALSQLEVGDVLIASQRAGDFTLPKDTTKKIGMIAGGIGVTPFASHIRSMLHTENIFDTVLFYANQTKNDKAYTELWNEVNEKGKFQLVDIFADEEESESYETGYISKKIILKHSPDYKDRVWYISGPPAMVKVSKNILISLGVSRSSIKEDFFPGLA